MSLTNLDLNVYQGDDPGWTVNVLNDDGSVSDLTDYTAQAQIRRAVADSDPVVVAEMGAVIELPNLVRLSLTHAQTETMNGRYVWDLQLTGASGEILTIVCGKVKVTPEVTREVA